MFPVPEGASGGLFRRIRLRRRRGWQSPPEIGDSKTRDWTLFKYKNRTGTWWPSALIKLSAALLLFTAFPNNVAIMRIKNHYKNFLLLHRVPSDRNTYLVFSERTLTTADSAEESLIPIHWFQQCTTTIKLTNQDGKRSSATFNLIGSHIGHSGPWVLIASTAVSFKYWGQPTKKEKQWVWLRVRFSISVIACL